MVKLKSRNTWKHGKKLDTIVTSRSCYRSRGSPVSNSVNLPLRHSTFRIQARTTRLVDSRPISMDELIQSDAALLLEHVMDSSMDLDEFLELEEPNWNPSASTSRTARSGNPSASTTGARIRSHRRMNPKQRISPKEQINELKETVKILSQRLRDLKNNSLMPQSQSSQVTAVVQTQIIWEGIAARQLSLRRKVEEENAELKKCIAANRQQRRNVRRMLRRRQINEIPFPVKNPKKVEDEQIFQQLMGRMQQLSLSADKLYRADQNPQSVCPSRKRQIYPDAMSGIFVEFLDARQVPFSVIQAEKAIWTFVQRQKLRDGQQPHEKDSQYTEDSVAISVGYGCTMSAFTSFVQERTAMRKFMDDERVLFIIQTMSDPTSNQAKLYKSFRTLETVTVIVKRGKVMASGRKTSIIETRVSVARCGQGNDLKSINWVDHIRGAADGWDDKVSFYSQEIENLLFVELIASK